MKSPAVALAVALGLLPTVAVAQMSMSSSSPARPASASAAANPSANPVSDAIRSDEQRMARELVGAMETFPADKYGYKPTEAQMTVGAIAVHLIEGNDRLCSTVGGTAAPQRTALTATAPKEQLVAQLRESFQYCETALAGLADGKLGDQVPSFGGRQDTRAMMALITVGDWADHYSQLANYLRLNNLLPPTAQRRQPSPQPATGAADTVPPRWPPDRGGQRVPARAAPPAAALAPSDGASHLNRHMSTKRQAREARRQRRASAPGPSLLRRTRNAGGFRVGLPVVVLIALAFVLWIVFDLGGLRP